MDIKVADERIVLLESQVSSEQAQELAWGKKIDAFGTINKVSSFLSKPKDDDFELVYREYRLQPFWHVKASAHYVYDRKSMYQIPVTGQEVLSVTLDEKEYAVTNGHVHATVVEHCTQDESEELLIDAVSGEKNQSLAEYTSLSSSVISAEALSKRSEQQEIVVPPTARISAILRDVISQMIKGIQADEIFEEDVRVSCVDLYYRPVHAYQYKWLSKGRDAIVEVDAVTGKVSFGNRTFKEYVGKVIDKDFLIDLGIDAADIFVPGGGIAIKMAKKFVDSKKKK